MMTKEQPSSPGQEAKLQRQRWSSFLLTLPFAILFLVDLDHHQMWRDELNVWGIAKASHTLWQLAHNIHYEGHPGLWYYVVWIPTRFSSDPAAMKWVEAAIGLAIYFIIGLLAPWTWYEKVPVFLSYYIAFEYTVISRTYGLGLLLALCYICIRIRKPQAALACGALLGLLANTDIIGVILSMALLMEYAWHLHDAAKVSSIRSRPKVLAAGFTYAVFVILSYVSLRPANDISWATTGRLGQSMTDPHRLLVSVISNFGLPWFPLSAKYPGHFWNPMAEGHILFFLAGSALVVAAVVVIFKRSLPLLAMIGLTAGGSILFSQVIYLGHVRHFGVIFVAFLLAYWIKRSTDDRVPAAALLLLWISALGGIGAIVASWTHPFSNAKTTAQWLRANHLDDKPLVGFPDYATAGVAEELNRPIYFAQCNCTDTYMQFSRRRDDVSDEHLPGHLRRVDHDLSTNEYTFISGYRLWPEREDSIRADGQQLTLLASFTDAIEPQENFYVYDIRKVP